MTARNVRSTLIAQLPFAASYPFFISSHALVNPDFRSFQASPVASLMPFNFSAADWR